MTRLNTVLVCLCWVAGMTLMEAAAQAPVQPPQTYGFAAIEAALEAGQIPEAETLLRARIAQAPEDARAALLLGNLALTQGQLDAAAAWYRQGLDADPGNAELYNNQGVLQLKQTPPAPKREGSISNWSMTM